MSHQFRYSISGQDGRGVMLEKREDGTVVSTRFIEKIEGGIRHTATGEDIEKIRMQALNNEWRSRSRADKRTPSKWFSDNYAEWPLVAREMLREIDPHLYMALRREEYSKKRANKKSDMGTEPSGPSDTNQKEVIVLKPQFMGMSIDVKELAKRAWQRWKSRQK